MTPTKLAIAAVKSCPFVLAQRVRVKQRGGWTTNWPDTYTVVGLLLKHNTINVWLYNGVTISDGFGVDDLETA